MKKLKLKDMIEIMCDMNAGFSELQYFNHKNLLNSRLDNEIEEIGKNIHKFRIKFKNNIDFDGFEEIIENHYTLDSTNNGKFMYLHSSGDPLAYIVVERECTMWFREETKEAALMIINDYLEKIEKNKKAKNVT